MAVMVVVCAVQICIIEFGSMLAFMTTPLCFADYCWSILFGAGIVVWTQVWRQIINLLSKFFTCCDKKITPGDDRFSNSD